MNFLDYIDIRRIAGVRRILGIDLTENRARIVELERRGNIFNRFRTNFKALKSLVVAFEPSESFDQKAEKLSAALLKANIRTKFAVSSVQALGMKTVVTTIPAEVENIDDWVKEHFDKLLKLPLQLHEVSFRVEVLRKSPAGITAEVTFLRNSDVEKWKEFFRRAGFKLFSLGYGDRDALNSLIVGDIGILSETSEYVFFGQNNVSLTPFSEGKRGETRRISREEVAGTTLQVRGAGEENRVFAGEISDALNKGFSRVLTPFGLASEFTLAAGLAVKGFLREISPADFLGSDEHEKLDAFIYRAIFQRLILGLGATLVVILAIQMLSSYAIQQKIDSIEDNFLKSGNGAAEVNLLEQQVEILEKKLHGKESSLDRTNAAKVLHDIAKAMPDSAWLYKFSLESDGAHQQVLNLFGYASSTEAVTTVLRNLRLKGNCTDANLVRAGDRLDAGEIIPVRGGTSAFTVFEIKATVQK